MKIRTDFVTNSSSSTFYVNKKTMLEFEDSGREYLFEQNKNEYRTLEEDSPDVFREFVNWHYLMKGVKPTVSKLASGKGIDAFANYLIDKKKETGNYTFKTHKVEYYFGYGESIGNDIDNEEKYLISHLHPVLREFYTGKHLMGTIFDVHDLPFIKYVSLTGRPEGPHYFFDFVFYDRDFSFDFRSCPSYELWADYFSEFEVYLALYLNAGAPELPFDMVEDVLLKGGVAPERVKYLKDLDAMVVYFANKTKKNDVIAYMDKTDHSVHLYTIASFNMGGVKEPLLGTE